MNRRKFIKSASGIFVPAIVGLSQPSLAQTFKFGSQLLLASGRTPTFVGAAKNTTRSQNPQTVTKSVTAGNLLIWAWFNYLSSSQNPSPSDGVNTWTKDSNSPLVDSSVSASVVVCYCIATTTGSITVTASTGNADNGCVLMEYSGVSTKDSSAKTVNHSGSTSANAITTGSVTTASNGCLVIGIVFDAFSTPTSQLWTAGTSPNAFNDRPTASNDPGGATGLTWHIEDLVQSSAGAINPTFTESVSTVYDGYTMAFH